MEDSLIGHVMPLALSSMNIFTRAKHGMNIDQVNSRGNSIPKAPMGRKETLEEVLDLVRTYECRHDERSW